MRENWARLWKSASTGSGKLEKRWPASGVLVVAPTAPEELRRRLGPLPLLEGQEDLTALLSERYRNVSQRRWSWPSGRGVHPDSYRALLWSVLSDNRGI